MSDDPKTLSRRRMLQTCSSGFGLFALTGILNRAASVPSAAIHGRTVKSVILCYMSGGISHIDSFDPKPRLTREAGQPMPLKIERTQFNNNGRIFPSPFPFRRHGESGMEISSLFPCLAQCVDDMALIRSMTTPVNEHAQGNFAMHTGFPLLGYPSAGAWISYGLGSMNDNLPSYVVLQSGHSVVPHGGPGLFSSGFLPAQHQATLLKADDRDAVENIRPSQSPDSQRKRLGFVEDLDRMYLSELKTHGEIEAAIENFETAFKMQTSVPEVCDISGESEATRELYGLNDPDEEKAAYARQALLARRLVERGVRFVELSCLTKGIGAGGAPNPWDQHGDLEKGHQAMAYQVDQPIAALLKDLKARGLLDETLVVFTGEFGRTPFSQGSNGRDHNPFGFSLWLAGGGIQGGTVYGATDEYGYHAIENPCSIYDLWATSLHLMGIDHEALTYRYGGRDMRLTDVHGRVLKSILS